jgi:hypothetical protein
VGLTKGDGADEIAGELAIFWGPLDIFIEAGATAGEGLVEVHEGTSGCCSSNTCKCSRIEEKCGRSIGSAKKPLNQDAK